MFYKIELAPFAAMQAAYEYYKRKQKGVSFYFVLNPLVYWSALHLDPQFMDELYMEGAVIRVRSWNPRGIGQRLDDFDKLSNDHIRQTMFEISGGWPWLLDEIMERCGSDVDPQEAAEKVRALLSEDGEFRQNFIRKLELPEDESFWSVLRFLAENKEVPVELISPELIDSSTGMNLAHCARALEFMQQFSLVKVVQDTVYIEPVIRMVLST